jgi:hypothetical protein
MLVIPSFNKFSFLNDQPQRYFSQPFLRNTNLFEQKLELVKKVPETANSSELEGFEIWDKMEYSAGKIYTGSRNTNTISVWDEKA